MRGYAPSLTLGGTGPCPERNTPKTGHTGDNQPAVVSTI